MQSGSHQITEAIFVQVLTAFSNNSKERNMVAWLGLFFSPPQFILRDETSKTKGADITKRSCSWARNFPYCFLILFLFIFTQLWRKPKKFINLKQIPLTFILCSGTFLLILSCRKKCPSCPCSGDQLWVQWDQHMSRSSLVPTDLMGERSMCFQWSHRSTSGL